MNNKLPIVILFVLLAAAFVLIAVLSTQVSNLEEKILEPWDAQLDLNEVSTQRDNLQDARIAELEANVLDIYDHINGMLDNILFIFRVIDDYVL
jgi:hypothetical protein